MPQISVLMPVYNAADYLSQAIDSIINQSFLDWELVIIDDGSTDKSDSIIRSYSDLRIKYYQNESNIGLIKTLNKGVALCEGKYVARMDADDEALPNRLKAQFDFLEAHTDYALCGTYAYVINSKGAEIGHIRNFTSDEYIKIHLLFSVPFVHPSVMIRTSILKTNPFDENYKLAEDYELWARLADKYKMANLSQYLLNYRWHGTNVSIQNSKIQDKVKDGIIIRELNKLGLEPSDNELYLHKISFLQYNSKEQVDKQPFTQFEALDLWYSRILEANCKKQKYNQEKLVSYLWSRWIILCISQKKLNRIYKPTFLSSKPGIVFSTLRLLYTSFTKKRKG